eukprot:TRINITY_DN982_c0_g1_i1.p1 TRINITY_DN982_c0_g1~~TRINITY_DN982_c0_g1_i1.p1  ORF type:complete len:659 (+),score=167.27 TRINITY_DN982_c0_g1_i1:72-2048(+)
MNRTHNYKSSTLSTPSTRAGYVSSWAGAPLRNSATPTPPPRGTTAVSSPIGIGTRSPGKPSPSPSKTDSNQCKYLSPQRPAKGGSPIREIAKVDDLRTVQTSPLSDATMRKVMQLETALATLQRNYDELKVENDKLLVRNADNLIADPPEKVTALRELLKESEEARAEQRHNLEEADKIIKMLKEEMRERGVHHNRNDEVAALREELRMAHDELKKKQYEENSTSASLREALHQRDQAEDASETMLQELGEAEKYIQQLKTQCAEHETTKGELARIRDQALQEPSAAAIGENDELQQKVESLEARLREVTAQRNEAEKRVEQLCAEHEATQEELTRVRDATQALQESNRSSSDAASGELELKQKVESLEATLREVTTQRDEAEKHSEQLRAQCAEHEATKEELARAREASQALKQSSSSSSDTGGELDELKQKVEGLEATLREVTAQRDAAEKHIEQLRVECAEHEATKEELARVKDANQALQEFNASSSAVASGEADGLRQKVEGLEASLREVTAQRDEAEKRSEQLRADYEATQEELARVKDTNEALHESHARSDEASGEIDELKQKAESLETRLREVTIQRDQAEQAAEAILDEKLSETEKLAQCNRELKEAISQRDQAEQAAETLMEEIQHTEDARDQAERAAEHLLVEVQGNA